MILTEYTDDQRRVFIDSEQLYQAYIHAFRSAQEYSGGMHWKKAKGREYLFKTTDRFGNGRSIGPRSPETEEIHRHFHRKKKEVEARVKTLKEKLNNQSRYCKAVRIQRLPKTASRILRLLDQNQLLGSSVQVIGTNALYAYEAKAGVFLERSVTATSDMDILWDIRPKLSLIFRREDRNQGFLGILRKADRSFERLSKGGYRAVNRDGYMVDLIKPEPKPPFKKEKVRMGGQEDLVAAELKNLQWLLSAPGFSQVVIGEDGLPAPMICPDPRAFALHKFWLSKQEDREPPKKGRDYNQSQIVAQLVLQYMPQLKFQQDDLRMFPPGLHAEMPRL